MATRFEADPELGRTQGMITLLVRLAQKRGISLSELVPEEYANYINATDAALTGDRDPPTRQQLKALGDLTSIIYTLRKWLYPDGEKVSKANPPDAFTRILQNAWGNTTIRSITSGSVTQPVAKSIVETFAPGVEEAPEELEEEVEEVAEGNKLPDKLQGSSPESRE